MKAPILILFLLLFTSHSNADELNLSRFAQGISDWENKSFKGHTDYHPVKENGNTVIRAHCKATASGLIKKVQLNPEQYRHLRWSWKIADTVAGGDEQKKAGDDYAARVYVIFPGRFLWQTRAINYIWANRLGVGRSIPNAFSSNAMMLAVESGNAKAGQWLHEQRDVVADYRQLFGEDPRHIGAIAIMTDCDNTGSEASAWYGDISMSTSK